MASPFDVLGVDPDTDEEALVAAYRERVKETHPDLGGSVAAFQRVRTAYEAITHGETEDWETETQETAGDPVEPETPQPTTVEYLNYDAIADHDFVLEDEDLFEQAANAELAPADYGEFLVQPHESLLEAAENSGQAWPFACRGGACANCSVAIVEGKLAQPVDTILSDDLYDRGFRLSCNGIPITNTLQVIYNVKHLPGLDELRLPPGPFELAQADD
jgi:ferredoxin